MQVRDHPAGSVRLIDPFGVGGGPDLVARALAEPLSELWGLPVTVENHPGAGSTSRNPSRACSATRPCEVGFPNTMWT